MNELRVEGVRCFREEQRIPIRPVTLLVGENSAGKSTVLALVRAAWDVAFGATEPDFNEQPFDLGGFDAIAHHQAGRTKRVQEFKIGGEFSVPGRRKGIIRSVTGTFTERIGQPVLSGWIASQDDIELSVDAPDLADVRVIGKQRGSVLIDEHLRDYRRRANLVTDAFLASQARVIQLPQKGKWLPAQLLAVDLFDLFDLLPGGTSSKFRLRSAGPFQTRADL
jgi:hypothetical protein